MQVHLVVEESVNQMIVASQLKQQEKSFFGLDRRAQTSTAILKDAPNLKGVVLAQLFDVISASFNIENVAQFCQWTNENLQQVMPHGILMCGIGQMENHGAKILKLLPNNFPAGYIAELHQAGGMAASPVFMQWMQTRRPVLYEPTEHTTDSPWMDNFLRYDLQNIAAHGLCDVNSNIATYFSFSRVQGKLGEQHAKLLEMLIPHMHVALIRAFNGSDIDTNKLDEFMFKLTDREHEVLRWLKTGKTNKEISHELSISENTVKNHVQSILDKLDVKSRSEAVAKI
jgi:LuxR family transcriptional regulator, quorum-sensing system regulator CviR